MVDAPTEFSWSGSDAAPLPDLDNIEFAVPPECMRGSGFVFLITAILSLFAVTAVGTVTVFRFLVSLIGLNW